MARDAAQSARAAQGGRACVEREAGGGRMIAMIDNYDSFTYNLVQYLGELGAQVRVFRNDEVTLEELEALAPSHVVLSPGPGTPDDAGITLALIERLAG